jgi:hypothetical protein
MKLDVVYIHAYLHIITSIIKSPKLETLLAISDVGACRDLLESRTNP